MQSFNLGGSITRFDPVQKSEQWKQLVSKEDHAPHIVQSTNARRGRAPLSNMSLVPGFATGVPDESDGTLYFYFFPCYFPHSLSNQTATGVGPLPKFNQVDISRLKKTSRTASTLQSTARSTYVHLE